MDGEPPARTPEEFQSGGLAMFRARAMSAARAVRSAPDDTARVDLESARLQGADPRPTAGARGRDQGFPDRGRLKERRSPRPESRCRGADYRPAPGLRLAVRSDRLGHRPPVL